MIVTNLVRAALVVLLAACACVGSAAAAEPAIHIVDAWARATPPGVANGAVYCKILNHGGPDRLVGARSAAARTVEIHESLVSNGVAEMHRVDSLPVAGGASIELAPGGTHAMLVGLTGPLVAGTKIELTLVFAAAGELTVEVPVVDARSPPAANQHEHRAQ